MARPSAGLHGGAMTTDDARLGAVRVWSAVLGSLVPCVALLTTITLAEDGVGVDDLAAAAPLSLFFVAVPSAIAIVASRNAATRAAVTLVMTGVAVFAGVQVATIDDGQAGLAVIYVPMVAFPLAGVVQACHALEGRFRSGEPDPPADPT
jgi:hypothetical protein